MKNERESESKKTWIMLKYKVMIFLPPRKKKFTTTTTWHYFDDRDKHFFFSKRVRKFLYVRDIKKLPNEIFKWVYANERERVSEFVREENCIKMIHQLIKISISLNVKWIFFFFANAVNENFLSLSYFRENWGVEEEEEETNTNVNSISTNTHTHTRPSIVQTQ